jgi:hypothetical protein
MENWRVIWKNNNPSEGTVEIHLDNDLETNNLVDAIIKSRDIESNSVSASITAFDSANANASHYASHSNTNNTEVNKFIKDSNGIDELANKLTTLIMV